MPIPPLLDDIDDTLFPALNLVLIGYGCLCLVPSWRYTQPLVQGLVFCYSLLYALLIAHRLAAGPLPAGAGIDSLEAVVALFSDRNAVFAGWTHYIAFDLFVSSWIVRDARTSQIPHLCIVGMVPLTLMAGPAGLACYILFKSVWLKTVGPREQSNGRLCNTANSLTDQVQASYLRSPGLTVLYCAVTLLAGFMVLWVMVLPSSWLVGHSDFHDKMAGQIWDREGATPPTPKNLIFKYKMHPLVQFTHTLPSALWSLAIPLQLHPQLRSYAPRLHRATGYMFFVAACTMMAGLVIIDRRKLYYFETDFPDIAHDVGMSRFPRTLGLLPHKNGFRLLGVWFLFTIVYSVWCARKKKFRQHRDFLYRHIGAGIWVAVQRLYVGALSTQIPLEQKMNFGDGAIIGAFITITMAEVAIRLTRNGEKSGAKQRRKEKDT